MLLDRVAGCFECRPIVALLAAVAPRLTRELALMFIAMAVNAGRELDFEFRCGSRQCVASSAANIGMRKIERETGLRMIRDRKCRRAPALHRMAAFATTAILTFCKLSAVRIWFVAVGALLMWNRRFEISSGMTTQTLNIEMFPEQWETGLRVIERFGKARSLPRRRCMAGLASLLKQSVVGVAMTIRTAREREASVSSTSIRSRRMAALALHLLVLSGQRVLRLRMIKCLLVDACGLPFRRRMALCAIDTESALVNIFVTAGASWRQSHPCVVQIFARKERSLRRCDVLRIVARPAAYAHMFAVQDKAGRRVIESLRSRSPMHHLKVDAVVIGMALHTCCAGRAGSRKRRMKAPVLLDLILNFPMAIETLERGSLDGNLVTLNAVHISTQSLMRLRQRARRDLRTNSGSRQNQSECDEQAKLRLPGPCSSALPCAAFKARRVFRLSLAHRIQCAVFTS